MRTSEILGLFVCKVGASDTEHVFYIRGYSVRMEGEKKKGKGKGKRERLIYEGRAWHGVAWRV